MNEETTKYSRSLGRPIAFGILYFLLPIAVVSIASSDSAKNFMTYLLEVCFALVIVVWFIKRIPREVNVLLWTLLVLLVVFSSGGFLSPFFFLLYLMGVGLGFLAAPYISIVFMLSLITLFTPYIDASNDALILLSLISVIPIVVILRKGYLVVQQENKGILILETDKRGESTSLDEVLSNRVNQIGILLRQPITYIKQGLSLMKDDKLTEEEYKGLLPRMVKSADELFVLVKEFERGATKNTLIPGTHTADQQGKKNTLSRPSVTHARS